VLRQYLGDRRRQRRLAMIDVSDRPYIAVRLITLKFLFRHNSALFAPSFSLLAQNQIFFASTLKLLIVGAEELLSFNQPLGSNPLLKLLELFLKPSSENFEVPMPAPKIFNPVLRRFSRFAPTLGGEISIGPAKQPRPSSTDSENSFELFPPAIRNPESSINHEPRGVQSLRRALHLRDDFLRDGSRGLLIARKVHRVFRAALR